MKPGQLVSANKAFQNLNSEISDLAMIEHAKHIENVLCSLEQNTKTQVLEFARDLAMREKTVGIKNLRESLIASGVEIPERYIEEQLEKARDTHSSLGGSATVTPLKAQGGSIWGGNGVNRTN